MTNYIKKNDIYIDEVLINFLNQELFPQLSIQQDLFWKNVSIFFNSLEPERKSLVKKRLSLQNKINTWHKKNSKKFFDKNAYKKFLSEINYLIPEGKDFTIQTNNIDPEIALIAGPQLVVPILNARYAINAANARWGSLYDAFYGTNVIPNNDT